nr:rhomboid family intramembrane serine protease [Bacteroidota bacterium]
LVTSFWVWIWAREAYHIGASGVIYGLASFLFFSGIFRKESRLMAISLIIAFLYGGLIWGLFPELFPKKNISWESHLMGLLSGLVLALFFRKEGPQKKQWSWELEEETDDVVDEENAYWNTTDQKKKNTKPLQINYIYKEKDSGDKKPDQ